MSKRIARITCAAAVAVGLATLAACGSSQGSASKRAPSTAPGLTSSRPSGPVEVLYAGSLVNLMEHDLGGKLQAATGISFQGYAGGSKLLAHDISGKVRQGDVFISASPKVNATLSGRTNGDWVRWYATFGKAPLVIGYNPKSRFAKDFRAKPWYDVITESGLRLGTTDPKLDPKGQLAAEALRQGAVRFHLPDLPAKANPQTFPEEDLVGRLQSGQLDAGFFYSNEAKEQGIPTAALTGVSLAATYTVTVLQRAPHAAAGVEFVRYLLSEPARKLLTDHGLSVLHPTVTGDRQAVPARLAQPLGR